MSDDIVKALELFGCDPALVLPKPKKTYTEADLEETIERVCQQAIADFQVCKQQEVNKLTEERDRALERAESAQAQSERLSERLQKFQQPLTDDLLYSGASVRVNEGVHRNATGTVQNGDDKGWWVLLDGEASSGTARLFAPHQLIFRDVGSDREALVAENQELKEKIAQLERQLRENRFTSLTNSKERRKRQPQGFNKSKVKSDKSKLRSYF